MINGSDYIHSVHLYYSFLTCEFGLEKDKEIINGNAFYDVEFRGKEVVISISYENIEDHLQVIVFMLHHKIMANYDDKTKTFHLKELNRLLLPTASKQEIMSNVDFFAKFHAVNGVERRLLKEAKELRLCLKLLNEPTL